MSNVIPVEQKTVGFMGAELLGIKASDEKVYVAVKWVCEGMGLSKGQMQNERKRIQDDLVLSQGERNFVLPTNGGQQEVLCIELDFLPLWLAKISITPKMQEETPWLARILVEYQLKAKDVLAEAFLPKQPQSIEDLIIMQAQSVKEIRENQEKVIQHQMKQDKKLEVVSHRIDSLDTANIEGDLQQRFNKMIQRYAMQEGFQISTAWKKFDQAYNTAFRTNVTALRNNYAEKHGLKSLTRPQYFSLADKLQDAIRVADKLLNQKAV